METPPRHKAKKSLGQNFLKSKSALRAIVAAGELSSKDTVLEIGPGRGALTKEILATGARVIAVEKDRELIPLLEEMFREEIASGTLTLLEDDVLTFDPESVGLAEGAYKLIANIPYYITGAIFEKFLTESIQPARMVVLIQKEVAQRIVARNNKESILSLSIKAFGTPKIVTKVPRTAFAPAPKVDSAVLSIIDISMQRFLDKKAVAHFFTIVKTGFSHKRKLLKKNLSTIASTEKIERSMQALSLCDTTRAEDIGLETWVRLAGLLSSN